MDESGYTDPEIAALYELLNTWSESDDFYLGWVMSASSVLDVGCGTGAILRRARENGHTGRLVGLDPAEAMLDIGRRDRSDIEWIHGDLTTVQFDQDFDLVFMSGHTFQVFVTDADLRQTLAAIRSALSNGGRFVFETRNPRTRAWEHWIPENASEIALPDGGVVVDRQALRWCGHWTKP
jgi:ubiquinone/menaquinone biosynthesis C-methylase UbiE